MRPARPSLARTPAVDGVIRRFGRYEALAPLGYGGTAEVYLGRLRGEGGFEKLIAIKHLLPGVSQAEELTAEFESMFLDEARLAAQVRSPHVVAPLDVGRSHDGNLFIVLDVVLGGTLDGWLRASCGGGGVPDIRVTLEWIAQTAMGLHHAHSAVSWSGEPLGIVHRDVSPVNVLIGLDGVARLSDFGIAKAVHRLSVTRPGTLKGKLAYFSPEQVSGTDEYGRASVDHRSDIFSLGVVAWESFTGRRLFLGDSAAVTLDRVLRRRIPHPSELRADLPVPLGDCVMRALARDREERFATARQFAEELRALARAHMLSTSSEALTDCAAATFDPAVRALLLEAGIVLASADASIGTSGRPLAAADPSLAPEATESMPGAALRSRVAAWLRRCASSIDGRD